MLRGPFAGTGPPIPIRLTSSLLIIGDDQFQLEDLAYNERSTQGLLAHGYTLDPDFVERTRSAIQDTNSRQSRTAARDQLRTLFE